MTAPHPLTPASPPPHRTSATLLRAALFVVIGLMALLFAVVQLAQRPRQFEPVWLVERLAELTGYNPHPVKLLLPPVRPLSALALLGQKIFNDTRLSASGKQSCASCHSPAHGYGPPNNLAVQYGGAAMTEAGFRAAPSLGYLYRQASFSIGPDQGDQDVPVNLNQSAAAAKDVVRADKTGGAVAAAPAMVPQGGLFWDGRSDTLQGQALGPLLNPAEMANHSEAEVAQKLASAAYRDDFKPLFGNNILHQPTLLVSEATSALGRFQIEDASFHPFSSRYDQWLEGKARLSRAELRGLEVFNDPQRANCAGCHPSKPGLDGLPPLFTDTQFEALGVPRNQALAANKDAAFFDLGICGPIRQDLASQTQYCGMFLTPTLRNSAKRPVYFHNAIYTSLAQVLDFYNLRDTHPEQVYGRDASGKVMAFNDLPESALANVDHSDAPFNRHPGQANAMTEQEMADLIAFLGTLDDASNSAK